MTPICPGKGNGCTFPKCECMVPLERRVSTQKKEPVVVEQCFGTLPTVAEGLDTDVARRFDRLPPLADAVALTNERATTHGSFAVNSETFARLLEAVPLERFDRRVWYAVTMIYVKLARMASGKSLFPDHAADIAGYATLIQKEAQK